MTTFTPDASRALGGPDWLVAASGRRGGAPRRPHLADLRRGDLALLRDRPLRSRALRADPARGARRHRASRARPGGRPARGRGRRALGPRGRAQRARRPPRAGPGARGEGRARVRPRHVRGRRGRAVARRCAATRHPTRSPCSTTRSSPVVPSCTCPPGVVVDKPIVVLHWSQGEGRASFPHTLVVAEEAAQVAVVDRFSSAGGEHLVDAVVELVLGDGAQRPLPVGAGARAQDVAGRAPAGAPRS